MMPPQAEITALGWQGDLLPRNRMISEQQRQIRQLREERGGQAERIAAQAAQIEQLQAELAAAREEITALRILVPGAAL